MKIRIFLITLIFLLISTYSYGAHFYSGVKFKNTPTDGYVVTWTDTGRQLEFLSPTELKTNLGLGPSQTITVAKSGGQYTSIQTAIDAISDNAAGKRYVVLVYPGTYTEDITIEDYVSVVGTGSRTETVIAGTVTFEDTADNYAALVNATVDLTTTDDAVDLVTVTNGTIRLDNCRFLLTNTQSDHVGSLLHSTGGNLRVKNCYWNLNYDGTNAGANDFFVYDINGTTNFDFTGNEILVDVADADDTVVMFSATAASTGTSFFEGNDCYITLSSGSYAGVAGGWYAHGSSTSQVITGNHMHMTTSGAGTAYAVYINTTAGSGEVHSNSNQYWVEDFGTNYSFNIASGDTLFSHFDDVRADGGQTGAGTFTYVNSNADGDLDVSSDIELGHATDTTLSRAAAGEVDIEGNQIYHEGDENTIAGTISATDWVKSAMIDWADFAYLGEGGMPNQFALETDADAGNFSITSLAYLYGVDNDIGLDLYTNGTANLFADTLAAITAPDIRFRYDADNYLDIAVGSGGATVIKPIGTGSPSVTFGVETYPFILKASNITVNQSGSVVFGGTVSTPSSSSPYDTFLDSDAPGTDKDIARVGGNFLSGADGAEDGALLLEAMLAGSQVLVGAWDSDEETWTFGDSGTGEDLIWDFETATDNQVEVSSNSGATEISFSALDLVTTGKIMGGVNVSTKAGAYTIGTDDANEAYGTLFINSNVADLTLPATPVVGMSGCLMQGAGVTGIMTLQPEGTENLVYEGVEKTAGTDLASGGAATDRICWVAITTDHWLITSSVGIWGE